jgi:hypothetical protein
MKLLKLRLTVLAMIVVAAILLISGCVTKAPLSEVDSATIDSRLVGLWEGPKDNDESILLAVVPFDQHGYMLIYSTYSVQDGKIVRHGQLQWRAWLTQLGGKDFYTVDVRSPRTLLAADAPKDQQNFVVGTWALQDDSLKLTVLNLEKHDEIKAVATTADLQKLVLAHINDETFFKDLIIYKKVSAEHQKDALAVLEKFETKD